VFFIRKAIDERKDARLLRLEGWAANAQLLRDAVPHARRVDAVDIQPHAERRQRDSRFLFMPMLRQVLRFRRGRQSDGLRPVAELRPASIMGGPSNQRSLLAESMRESQVRQDEGQRRARNGGQRAESAGETRRREQRREKSGPRTEQPREKASHRTEQPRAQNGQPRRTRPMRKKPEAPTVVNGPVQEGSTEPQPRKRSRRGRRGSGRSRKANGGVTSNATAEQVATDTIVEPAAGATEPAPEAKSDAQSAEPGSMEGAAPRRRRSNRRGGRGRRRRSNGEAQTNEQSGAGPDAAIEAAPTLDQASTPKAS
jgi:hypothetical protein